MSKALKLEIFTETFWLFPSSINKSTESFPDSFSIFTVDCTSIFLFKESKKVLAFLIKAQSTTPILEGIDGEYFYFVHSYHVVPDNDEIIAGVCEYGGEVVASLSQNNLFSTQFHPEKSGVAGLRILKNFTNLEI